MRTEKVEMRPVLKYPGSKWKMAEWIISLMPPHKSYLEPFFGSGAVFFKKEPSRIETINDMDGEIVNLFRCIREEPEELMRCVTMTPYSRAEYKQAWGKFRFRAGVPSVGGGSGQDDAGSLLAEPREYICLQGRMEKRPRRQRIRL